MFIRAVYLLLLLFDFITEGLNHVGQPCNRMFRICLASNSYCDKDNICQCKPEYPVNISLHSCKKGKHYSEQCRYTEECSYFDPYSYCTQIPYRSICECHSGFSYDKTKQLCEKMTNEVPKPSNVIFPIAMCLLFAFPSILCCCIGAWHVCKRHNINYMSFFRNRVSSRSQYLPTEDDNQRPVASAPPPDEALPTYDTALSLKIADDSEPPPSYEDVIGPSDTSKV